MHRPSWIWIRYSVLALVLGAALAAPAAVPEASAQSKLICDSIQPDIKPKTKEENSAMSGTSDKIKGRVKEAVGVLTDDRRLKNEGKLDQATGKIKEVVERGIDKATSVVKRRAKK